MKSSKRKNSNGGPTYDEINQEFSLWRAEINFQNSPKAEVFDIAYAHRELGFKISSKYMLLWHTEKN